MNVFVFDFALHVIKDVKKKDIKSCFFFPAQCREPLRVNGCITPSLSCLVLCVYIWIYFIIQPLNVLYAEILSEP